MLELLLCLGMSNAEDVCQAWARDNTTAVAIVECAKGGQDIRRVHRQPDYWGQVRQCIEASGHTVDEITLIWHKNATHSRDIVDLETERTVVRDYFIALQAGAALVFPNLKAGYHSPRTSGRWCSANPEPYASDVVNGAAEAARHFDRWSIGPRIDAPSYVQADFKDGCHMSEQGLAKVVPIMNAFFGNATPTHTAPRVVSLGDGVFEVTWTGPGTALSCGAHTFAVTGESAALVIPRDLPLDVKHRCAIDGSQASNRFGCSSAGNCRTW